MNWDSEDEFSGRKVYRNEEGELVELKPGAKWCIAMNAPTYWESYCFYDNISFYFLFREDESLSDKEKKIAISVDFMNKKIVTYTFGDDTSRKRYALPKEYKNLIFNNLNKCVEKVKQNIRKGLVLNPNTNRYDYKGSINIAFLRTFNLFKIDESGNKVGFAINFGEVTGNFYCTDNQLTSLEGAPQKVGGNFNCSRNQLTSLEGAPQIVGKDFYCHRNQLISLKGAPKEVGRGFQCYDNQLTSLKGTPQKIGGYFDCHNNQLTSLEGAPKEVGGGFDCSNNELTSLEGAPHEVGGGFDCSNNSLTSLEGAPKEVGWNFDCSSNKLISLKGAPQKVSKRFYCNNNPNLHSLDGIGEVKEYNIYKDF